MSDKSSSLGGAIEPFGFGPRLAPFLTAFSGATGLSALLSTFAGFSDLEGLSALVGFKTTFSSMTGATGFVTTLIVFSPGLGARFNTGAVGDTLLFDEGTDFTFEAVFATDLTATLEAGFVVGFVTAIIVFLTADLTEGLAMAFAAGLTSFFVALVALTTLAGAAGFFTGLTTGFFVDMIENLNWTKQQYARRQQTSAMRKLKS
jgi:hypothetical protein